MLASKAAHGGHYKPISDCIRAAIIATQGDGR